MQCLTHVIRMLVVMAMLCVAVPASADQVRIDQNYCESFALYAKAGQEAKQRGETKGQWRANLQALKGYVVKNKDNVLYSILPRVIEDNDENWDVKYTPMNRFLVTFNNCMAKDFDKVVTLAY